MIPKIIHYCWFGGNPLPTEAQRCINTWKKYCPDYDIKEWNESNFFIDECDYAREAYNAKKWAFVSDYARFKILYDEGGVYFDTDVELIKSIDSIISKGAFMGLENELQDNKNINHRLLVAPGLGLAISSGHPIYKELIEYYKNIHFLNNDGSYNLKTVVEHTTDILKNHGMKDEPGIQNIEGINIYPKDYFNPMDMDSGKIIITNNTVSIHHYLASWVDEYSVFRGKVYKFITRVFGKNAASAIRKVVGR